MNQENNPGEQGSHKVNPASHKRGSRADRNRPVLVATTTNEDVTSDQPVEETSEATQPVAEVASTTTVEAPRPRRLPKFFSNVIKSDQEQAVGANPAAARIARAIRGTGASPESSQKVKESKPAEPARTSPAKASTTRPAPRPGGFKTKYIFGMLIYLVLAEVVGGYEKTLLANNHADKLLLQLGPLPISTSTLLFLLTLILLLVILARLDLVPRSLGALSGQPTPQRRPGQSQNTTDSETGKSTQPTMKQGVKGADDDLYQEYREQQRYLQRRRERKR